ncbi:MAG: hypothetical protein HY040_25405 [Planctomycetes bacterium]|nr:hypothetical protein [Planctomycetota bacterium]
MLRLAMTNGKRSQPFPRGRGVCPTCGGQVIAKCGRINIHHWAHVSAADCDAWSENIGPWHISWQDMARPQFVEVCIGEHRADILGNADTVIELQHSPISPATIQERERFYGDMVWVFDATDRFAGMMSGERFFFTLGRAKHIRKCKKPVFLDFGGFLVQIESMSKVLTPFSGFGRIRDREWFATEFLSERRAPEQFTRACLGDNEVGARWVGNQPWQLTAHPSEWLSSSVGKKMLVPKGTPFLPLEHGRVDRWNQVRPVWSEVIRRHPELANGWSEAEFRQMMAFLHAKPTLLAGLLRLMPSHADAITVSDSVGVVSQLLEKTNAHVRAGRLPLLKEETRRRLLERAEAVEEERARSFK